MKGMIKPVAEVKLGERGWEVVEGVVEDRGAIRRGEAVNRKAEAN